MTGRRLAERSAFRLRLVAMRYSQVRIEDRSPKSPLPFQAASFSRSWSSTRTASFHPVVVIFARVAWRYRSELALFTACVTLGAGWWAHLAHPNWWPYLLGVAVASAGVLVPLGARLGS